jgi:uncharacterized protein
MPRPPKTRSIQGSPRTTYFKPRGVPAQMLETVVLGLDELEAMLLADLDGLYQQEAAERMGISRPTFGRLVAEARGKVADALFHGKALVLEGGAVRLGDAARFECGGCGRNWDLPAQSAVPDACGSCGSERISSTRPAGCRGEGRGRRCAGQGNQRPTGGQRRGRGCDR